MNNKRLVLIGLFIFLLVISIVFAVKPVTQTSEGVNTFEIRIPQAEHLKVGRDVHANIHIFNKSTGLPIASGTGAVCLFDLYNQTGDHLIEKLILENDGDVEWEIDIGGGNFSTTGSYSFIIWCNTTTLGGFVSSGFDVTTSGEDEVEDNMPLVIIGGILIVIALYFIVLIRMFAEREFTEHGMVRMLFYLTAFWVILIPVHVMSLFLEHYSGPEEVIGMITLMFQLIVWLNYFITVYFILWFLIQLFKKIGNTKNKLMFDKQPEN